ncbi:NAD(P)/FAD-dependent oxidoreductase [Agrobacterium cavarae]|uniref:NAD(P)/FAD-dependent oxidoreductase n=1 Tax=Agrobacterium cavarae TaxID=2528239 RepID=UPI002898B069|nr:FAD-dependent oxidoreductase [Agrobacterium cavarae]
MNTGTGIKIAVVGRGLIGSAAARHLSKMGHAVALIGPDEPEDFSRHTGVFGSHYDEGRITRRFDPEPFWFQMNRAAISRYDEISAESGVEFYREAGVLHVGDAENPNVALVAKVTAENGILCESYKDTELAERFPLLKSTAAMQGYLEPHDAGYISPRRLVRAQTIAAQRAGARIIAEAAIGISESQFAVTVRTNSTSIDVDHVLVAAGGHTIPSRTDIGI